MTSSVSDEFERKEEHVLNVALALLEHIDGKIKHFSASL